MSNFKLNSKFKPSRDQARAIKEITEKLQSANKAQTHPKTKIQSKRPTPAETHPKSRAQTPAKDVTLLGVTGSGKTFTMANVIENLNRPTLILSHNKTLAAQLYEEYKSFFPDNAVKYFVSYYDYYQPEAYVPGKDLYIEKEADINKEIERYRLSAMNSAIRRRDTIVVASVSCIYNIGKPDTYENMTTLLNLTQNIKLSELKRELATLQYEHGRYDFEPGTFRVKGDILEIYPPYEEYAIRIELFGDDIENISIIDPLTGQRVSRLNEIEIYPAKNFVAPQETINRVVKEINADLQKRVEELEELGKDLEAQRLTQRTLYDIEMLEQTGFCSGIENYSIYFDDRDVGDPPYCLLDYFPDDYLMIIDESHMTVPQVGGMYNGDRARKKTLVEHGFRLPTALDNRPLNFEEFLDRLNQTVYTSATPGDWEIERSKPHIVEQIIRPTGLIDPKIEVRPTKNQIDDVIEEVQKNIEKKQRTLITTLTKRMSEDLANYLKEMDIKVHYLHSEIDTVERIDILRNLRLGTYDVVVGINLLREGLDLPEVSLVIILDADKQGFLRSSTSLIQTIGRAARHVDGRVIMYADETSEAMAEAISETNRRRKIQKRYNQKYKIKPKSIKKDIRASWRPEDELEEDTTKLDKIPKKDIKKTIKRYEDKMYIAAQNLNYEKAAEIRDKVKLLKQKLK